MVTEKIQRAIDRYPELADVVEIAGHYDDNHPIHRLCAYLANLTADIMDTVPPQPEANDEK